MRRFFVTQRRVQEMKFESIHICNFKSIKALEIKKMENACIFIGKNSTGKTVILDALLTVCGEYELSIQDFNQTESNIEITITLLIEEEDIRLFHKQGIVSKYKRFELWKNDFMTKIPSYQEGMLTFMFVANKEGRIRYGDGMKKDNPYIRLILPKLYYIDHRRSLKEIENDIMQTGMREKTIQKLQAERCIFDEAKKCNECFQCIGMIHKKRAEELTIFETEKLLEYKLFHLDMDHFMERLNRYFAKNSGLKEELINHVHIDINALLRMEIAMYSMHSGKKEEYRLIQDLSEGMKSIYILSLLEAYMEETDKLPCIIIMEDPELFLHPQLQKNASEILYRLSRKNQVLFSTHSPNMIFNFNSRQIKQVCLDEEGYTIVHEQNDIGRILNDLGYSANDLMNVNFVFIVEGKQDKSRLPLLLNEYYSEVYNKEGKLQRISIITTNSCTNIKTYANLKYINQVFLQDQFLMIRDSDGKDPKELGEKLCRYYEKRGEEERDTLPRVTSKNVLILKYYSFENYFLNPAVMAQIGVIKSEEEFYEILWTKFKEYLYRLVSFQNFKAQTGIEIQSKEDIKTHLEPILVYARGHNLFDIFYGRYKGELENDILKKYISAAPRNVFEDILSAIDRFVYFDSRKI